MTRKSYISIIFALVAATSALVIAPAAASDHPGSVTALATGYEPDSQRSSEYPGSVAALSSGYEPGSGSSESVVATRTGDFQPLNGILGEDSVAQAVPTSSVGDGGGFDWTDALIGALISSALLAMAFVAARSVGRRRRSTAESHA